MDNETAALLQEIVNYMSETEMQVRALRRLLVESGALTEEQVEERINEVKRDEYLDLRAEQLRRGWETIWKSGPSQ